MSIIRVSKRRTYTVVSNVPVNAPEIDFGALGLLTYLLSKPNGWNVSIKHLVKQKKDGETKVKGFLKTLQDNGYAEWKRSNTGRVQWTIYEEPKIDEKDEIEPNDTPANDHISPQGQIPHVEKPHVEIPHVENHLDIVKTQHLVNTDNKVNTDKEGYAFFGKKIKLTHEHYSEMLDNYPNLDLSKELSQLDLELREESSWFMPMHAKLRYRNEKLNGNQNNQKRETPAEKANRLSRELGQQAMATNVINIPNKLLKPKR